MTSANLVYRASGFRSSRHGQIFRAAILAEEASQLLRAKAAEQLRHCAPTSRLPKIATGLADFSNSLERMAGAIAPETQPRKILHPSTSEAEHRDVAALLQIEADLARAYRKTPIGGEEGWRLFARLMSVREELAAVRRSEAA